MEEIKISGVWVRARLGTVEVLVEVDGKWKNIFQEKWADKELIISHIIETRGIRGAPLDKVTEKD